MEPLLVEAVRQVPALVVLMAVVGLFLRSQVGFLSALGQFRAALEAMETREERRASECHEVQRETLAALRDNGVVVGGAAQAVREAVARCGTR